MQCWLHFFFAYVRPSYFVLGRVRSSASSVLPIAVSGLAFCAEEDIYYTDTEAEVKAASASAASAAIYPAFRSSFRSSFCPQHVLSMSNGKALNNNISRLAQILPRDYLRMPSLNSWRRA